MADSQLKSSASPTTTESLSAKDTDPTLLKQNSQIKAYTTSRFTYPGIRVFYRRHPQADKLPKSPAPLPLLVFIHGLGGSVAQFHPLLTSLVNISSCLAIDLPGCGVSEFSPTEWDAYSTASLVELLETAIEDHRDKDAGQSVVLIGHSMGTALAAQLADPKSSHTTQLASYVVGLVAICPTSGSLTEQQVSLFRKLLWIPGWLFNLWRAWDARGGANSASVRRFVGPEADLETRKMQYRYNQQSKTPVWRRTAWGTLPTFENGVRKGGLASQDVWSRINVPTYLIGGENDHITPPKELKKVEEYLNLDKVRSFSEGSDEADSDSALTPSSPRVANNLPLSIEDIRDEDFKKDKLANGTEETHDDPSTPRERPAGAVPPQPRHPRKIVKTTLMSPPANHALLYLSFTVRILSGLISDFLTAHITGRLSLGWQLQYLSQEGKWDVKNLAKWKGVAPVSEPIGPTGKPVFRAMKTLREVDELHCPRVFVEKWGATIKDVVDISHDQPVYDPRGMERSGIHYHKFPTVSKIPPTETEVDAFIALVDGLRERQENRAKDENWTNDYVVGVHCHYGFNRTGYFIVCYLIERCGFGVKDAIDAFAKARPNGIRHSHFLDRLYVRYCSGLTSKD
jgi:pimeloyl-ACP methyl ester carboxylesterase/protein-tyrosine phosphatase